MIFKWIQLIPKVCYTFAKTQLTIFCYFVCRTILPQDLIPHNIFNKYQIIVYL